MRRACGRRLLGSFALPRGDVKPRPGSRYGREWERHGVQCRVGYVSGTRGIGFKQLKRVGRPPRGSGARDMCRGVSTDVRR